MSPGGDGAARFSGRDAAAREIARGIMEFAASRGFTPSHEDLLDLLWLAAHLPAGHSFAPAAEGDLARAPGVRPAPRPAAEPVPKGPSDSPADSPADALSPGEGASTEAPDGGRVPVFPPGASRGGEGPALVLPSPPVLPSERAFLQACRPLMLRGPSRARLCPDVEETARRWADEGIVEVALRPATERRVELVVVLDFGPSMDMWRGLMREVARAFVASGGFRRVTVACMLRDGGSPRLVDPRHAADRTAPAILPGWSSGAGSRLLLIVTDCISRHWRGPEMGRLLGRWARGGASALLQVLPEREWSRTALGRAEFRRAVASSALAPNRHYREARDPADELDRWLLEQEATAVIAPGAPLLPVAPLLDVASLSRLARFLGGRTSLPAPCFRLKPGEEAPTVGSLDPSQALDAFVRRGSKRARELAILLAASPAVSLPIARILRRNFMGHAGGPGLEAEIWTSGLLELMEEPLKDDPDQVLYRYRAGIQRRLLDGSPRDLRQRVIEATSRYLEEHLGRLRGFAAMLADPASHAGGLETGPASDPMAWVAAEVLRRQGGDLARVAASYSGSSARASSAVADLAKRAERYLHSGEHLTGRFAWSPDGATLAVPTLGGRLVLVNAADNSRASVRASRQAAPQAAWSPDGTEIAIACLSRVVRVFNKDRQQLYELWGHQSGVSAVAYSPEGRYLASGTMGGSVRLWRRADREQINLKHVATRGEVRSLAWLDEERLAAGYGDWTVIYRAGPTGLILDRTIEAAGTALAPCTPAVAGWLEAEAHLAIGRTNGEIQFWRSGASEPARSLFPGQGAVTSIAASTDGRLLATKGRDGTVAVVLLATGKVVASMRLPPTESPYGTVAFRPGTSSLAVARQDDREVALHALDETPPQETGRLRIRVVGSGPVQTGFQDACRRIGREIASRHHELVISTANKSTADYHAFLGYLEAAEGGGRVTLVRVMDARGVQHLETLRSLANPAGSGEGAFRDAVVRELMRAFTPEAVRALMPAWSRPQPVGDDRPVAEPSFDLASMMKFDPKELMTLLIAAADRLPANRVLAALRDRAPLASAIELVVEPIAEARNRNGGEVQAFGLSDAAIAIGGERGTLRAISIAEEFEIPIVPLPQFDGAARQAWQAGAGVSSEQPADIPAWRERLGAGQAIEALSVADIDAVPVLAVDILESASAVEGDRPWPRVVLLEDASGVEPLFATGLAIDGRRILRLTLPAPPDPAEEGWRLLVVHDVEAGPTGPDARRPAREGRWQRRIRGAGLEWFRSEPPLEGFGEPPIFEAIGDDVLRDAPVRLRVARRSGGETIRGVVEGIDPETVRIWCDRPLPPELAGAPVVIRSYGRLVVMGMAVDIGLQGEPGSCVALRLTGEMIDQIVSPDGRDAAARPRSPAAGLGVVVPRWVRVVGSGRHYLSTAEREAARSVGRILADLSYGLITGGWPGVDYVAAQAFWEVLLDRDIPSPAARLVHEVAPGGKPDFPDGTVVEAGSPGGEGRPVAPREHAIVLIGGFEASRRVADEGRARGIPVFPIRGTGQEADALHEDMLASWRVVPGLPASPVEFEEAASWPGGFPDLLRSLLAGLPAGDQGPA
ncbi:WD domain, G-beta repeat [Aquisphaera giovannonii]|uniref:WD domain, G-beta repeat n=1 Tax=Aquisphaera giovannonii TaxID=406548 RepID=A0A5B9VW77_9BACT|nr:SAV_2336 N-terminal domain-related protein [Aquisphaera giovannonii]QEH32488.1 WD domain, G-beta repeat [Aquisphaera giovannonii]